MPEVDGNWRLWEQFALRGPGFPAGGVLRLAPADVARAADKFAPGEPLAGPGWEEFAADFESAAVRTAQILREIAAQPRFRAAVAWQNRAVLRTGIEPFLGWTPTAAGRTSMPRQREELVAHYWQRFCVKNDTIGFFGPVGWGSWDLRTQGVTVHPGQSFLAGGRVYFASWAIDALAALLDGDPAVRAWVPPRRVPLARLTPDGAVLPGRPAQPLPPLDRSVLELCDGTHAIPAIAEQLGLPVDATTEVVRRLAAGRWVQWRLEVPASTYPERELRAILERIGDPGVRDRSLAPLAELERGRAAVEAAGQDDVPLAAAIDALENRFAELTATPAQRAKGGRTAPCRAIVYGDCRRAATATVGRAVLAELTPLGMCLAAARWLTGRFARLATERLRSAYDRVLARQGAVDLAALWLETLPSPYRQSLEDVAAVHAELRAKWARVLDLPAGASRVRLASADIADRFRAEFGDARPGWSLARYLSPDLLVLAEGAAALERGEFELVLGEMHCALNTMAASLFVHQHPDRGELVAETDTDFPGPRLLTMLPKELPGKWSARSRPALDRPEDYYVALVEHTGDPYRPNTALAADVEVFEDGGTLRVRLPDGAEFDLLDVYANALTHQVMDRFTVRPAGDHTPRITIDKLVVARETWRFAAAELPWTAEKSEARRFVLARQWQREHGLPRYVFVVSPTEPRPFYLDFDSPVYVTIFAKAARRLARKEPDGRLQLSEMLPDPGQAWLTDADGNTYTSELRFVAVDQSGAE
jgi:Lantibiotic dehydratase, N terminus